MSKIQVKPKAGIQVRTEAGKPIPTTGMAVANNSYYRRRIKDGDLLLVTEQATPQSPRKGETE